MNKVLVTGGAGFIGYFLTKKLAERDDPCVTVIDNLSRGNDDGEFQDLCKNNNVNFIKGDLTNPDTFNSLPCDFDFIFHLAAVIGVKNIIENPDKALYVNSLSTFNLFEYAKKIKNLKRVIFSSTSEVYAGTQRHFGIPVPTDERVTLAIDDLYAPRTAYALSKIYGEAITLQYGLKYNIPVTVIRYHNVYGPRMGFSHVIPETFVKIKKDSTVDVSSPGHTRTFCYIDDAIEFTFRLADSKNALREVVNIGNPREEIRIRDLVLKIGKIMGEEIAVNELSDTPGSPVRRCPDISKAIKITGYEPKVLLEEGLKRTYQWYQDKI